MAPVKNVKATSLPKAGGVKRLLVCTSQTGPTTSYLRVSRPAQITPPPRRRNLRSAGPVRTPPVPVPVAEILDLRPPLTIPVPSGLSRKAPPPKVTSKDAESTCPDSPGPSGLSKPGNVAKADEVQPIPSGSGALQVVKAKKKKKKSSANAKQGGLGNDSASVLTKEERAALSTLEQLEAATLEVVTEEAATPAGPESPQETAAAPQVDQVVPRPPSPARTHVSESEDEVDDVETALTRRRGDIPPVIITPAFTGSLGRLNLEFKAEYEPLGLCSYRARGGTAVKTVCERDYANLCRFLTERGVAYNLLRPKNEKPLRFVLRGIDIHTDEKDIQGDLEFQSIIVRRVTRMHSSRTKAKLPMVIVDVENSPESRDRMRALRQCCLMRVTVEDYVPSKRPPQCSNCQWYYHTQASCRAQPMCRACARPHKTKDCRKPHDVPATCALCGGAHTANYGGCPVALQVRDATEGTSRAARRRRAELEEQRTLQYEWLRQQRVERAARQQQLFREQQPQPQARAPAQVPRAERRTELGPVRQQPQQTQRQQAEIPSLLDVPVAAPLWSTVAATAPPTAANNVGPLSQRPKRNRGSRNATKATTVESISAPVPPAQQEAIASTSKGPTERDATLDQVQHFAEALQSANPNLPLAPILEGLTKVIVLLMENPMSALPEIFKLLTSLVSLNGQTK